MFLRDLRISIKEAIFRYKYDEDLQYMRLKKYDAKMCRKNGGSLYWNRDIMTMKIMRCMMRQNGESENKAIEIAIWLARRFRYTNPEIIDIMQDFYHDEYYFDRVLYGQRIFDVMKSRCMSYPEAILSIYETETNFYGSWRISKYLRRPWHGTKMQYAYDFDLDNRIKYDFNRYNDVLSNLTIEQHEELMEAVRTSSIKIAKEMGIVVNDDEFDVINSEAHEEFKLRLGEAEKQILIGNGLWQDKYSGVTDEELADIDKRIDENLKATAAKHGLKFKNDEDFDNFKLEKYKELKARLIKNEKQILIDKGLWNEKYEYLYLTDEESKAILDKMHEIGRRHRMERGAL